MPDQPRNPAAWRVVLPPAEKFAPPGGQAGGGMDGVGGMGEPRGIREVPGLEGGRALLGQGLVPRLPGRVRVRPVFSGLFCSPRCPSQWPLPRTPRRGCCEVRLGYHRGAVGLREKVGGCLSCPKEFCRGEDVERVDALLAALVCNP